MAVRISPPVEVPVRPPRAITRTTRKIGLLGSHTSTLEHCPWRDPSWELWGHASSRSWYQREADCYFEMHQKERWAHPEKKGAQYPKWLGRNTTPIYMLERYPEAPASLKYPRGRIFQEFSHFPRRYFTNTVAWMIALALTEGATTIGLWGINYSSETEFGTQRGSCEFWLGVLGGRGVHVILPDNCSLLAEPSLLYGYESHDENGALVPEYRPKVFKPAEQVKKILQPGEVPVLVEPPDDVRKEIEEEERTIARPDWALKPREVA